MSIDPTKFHVETHTPPIWEREETFQEIMAEQLRHAPWLMLSIGLHLVVGLLLWLMPHDSKVLDDRSLLMAPPDKVDEIVEEPPPPEEPEPEETEVEPVLQDTEVTEVEEVTETFDEFDQKESAFDSNQWNSAVGLGGGAGGKWGGRGGGRKKLGAGAGKQTARAIELALEWLKKHQDEDGKWDSDEFMKHDIEGDPCNGPGNPVHDVGLTGLALLAFLGDGSTMRSGPYQEVVKKGVRWLRDQQDKNTGLFGTANSNEFIYNHAIATVAMVEAYGLSDYKILRKNAQDAINYLETHRNPYSVWRYQPRDGDNDTSVTGWCVMSYKSAQDFKLDVNQSAMKLSEAWFDQMTDPVSGRTGYTERGGYSSRRSGQHATHFPREKGECMTAVSLLCRIFLGYNPKEDKLMKTQADLILKKPPVWDEKGGAIDHYYWYYASYALYQMGGRHWDTWSKALTDAVVKPQRMDGNYKGSWDPACAWGEDGGRVYSTAILCLTLEAYYRYSVLVR
jgi:hypothetical protein